MKFKLKSKNNSLIEEIEITDEDTLVIETEEVISDLQMKRMIEEMSKNIKGKILILDGGMKLKVLKKK
jgi:hypothetical protein